MLNLKHLAYVVALARHRHFGRAAEHLDVSQSALSQGVAALERDLGMTLFDRGRNGVEPTLAGRRVIERAERLLADEASLRREIDEMQGLQTGSLAIGAGPHAADVFVAPALASLAQRHPGVRVRVAAGYFSEIHEQVLRGTVEVGVADIAGWRSDSRLTFVSLGRLRQVIAVRPGHPLAGRHGVTLAEVWSYPLTAPRLTGAVAAQLPAHIPAGERDEATGHFVPGFCAESVNVCRRVAASSDVVFGGPEVLIREDLDAGRLVAVDVSLDQMDLEYGAFHMRERTLSPLAVGFLALLEEAAAGMG